MISFLLLGGNMRTLFAILAAAGAGFAGSYLYNAYVFPNLPTSVTGTNTSLQNTAIMAVAVAVPAVIAYGMVAGLHHNAAGLPAKS
jgi:hypothetical protein